MQARPPGEGFGQGHVAFGLQTFQGLVVGNPVKSALLAAEQVARAEHDVGPEQVFAPDQRLEGKGKRAPVLDADLGAVLDAEEDLGAVIEVLRLDGGAGVRGVLFPESRIHRPGL
jgi:hypothetical protein